MGSSAPSRIPFAVSVNTSQFSFQNIIHQTWYTYIMSVIKMLQWNPQEVVDIIAF